MHKTTSNSHSDTTVAKNHLSNSYIHMDMESFYKFGHQDLLSKSLFNHELVNNSQNSPKKSEKFNSFEHFTNHFFSNSQFQADISPNGELNNQSGLDVSFETQFPENIGSLNASDDDDDTYAKPQFHPKSPEKPSVTGQKYLEPYFFVEKSVLISSYSLINLESNPNISSLFRADYPNNVSYVNKIDFNQSGSEHLKHSNEEIETSLISNTRDVSHSNSKKSSELSSKSKKISKNQLKKISNDSKSLAENRLTRKVVKNFGKAIATFACSLTAKPLILFAIDDDMSQYNKFLQFVYDIKDTIEGNRRFKLLLKPQPEDDLQMAQNKVIFKYAAKIFMGKFVYSWLWNSHVENKPMYAKLINQMRSRIYNPDLLDSLTC